MTMGVPLVLASGGGQCLAVNGCHTYGGAIVRSVVVITFFSIIVGLIVRAKRAR